jgi:hypothetical protein
MSDLKKQIDKGASKIEILYLLLVSVVASDIHMTRNGADTYLPYLTCPLIAPSSLPFPSPAALLLPSQGAQGETDHQPGVQHVYLFHPMRCSSGVFN